MKKRKIINKLLLITIFLLGFVLRFYISLKGFNYDYGSFRIVGDILVQGKNVYLETSRYNYGPIWALILGGFRQISLFFLNDWFIFRFLIIFLLAVVDFFISFIGFKYFGLISFLLVYFNPISIYTSGFHNQFDNLAILIGLVSLIILEKNRKNFFGYFLLGLSITTKHIFLFFPLWLLLSANNKKEKLYSLVPWFIFLISFLPFITSNKALNAVINNVFLYKRDPLYPFLNNSLIGVFSIFLLTSASLFFFLRKERFFYQGLWYLLIFFASIINVGAQYLAIPLVSFLINPLFSLVYTLIGTTYLFFDFFNLIQIQTLSQISVWLMIAYLLLKKSVKKLDKIQIPPLLVLLTILIISFFNFKGLINNFKNLIKTEKEKLFSMAIYKNPVKIFNKKIRQPRNPITKNNIVEGRFLAQENNLGYLIIPSSLDQQRADFFEKNYKIKLELLEGKQLIHQEVRSFGNALFEDGIIFGLPLIENSQGKKYALRISTDIPDREKSFFLDFDKLFQERYFLSKNYLNTIPKIFYFSFNKFINLMLNKNFIEIYFQMYLYGWSFLSLSLILKKRHYDF